MKNKKMIMICAILLFIIGLLSITYAVFNYREIGTTNEQLITGDIYMHYLESNTLTITDAFPRNAYDPTKYIEFTIDGKNTTTNHDVIYDILVIRGDIPNGKTESNRIADQYVKFRLTSISNNVETEIFTNKSYHDLQTSKRIHVATIPRNTTSEITHTYRLYMWIGGNIDVGNTETANYSAAEWNNIFASVKVNVTGDFSEKVVDVDPTSDSCFSVGPVYILNNNLSSSELSTCESYMNNVAFDTGTTATSFCQGTGTYNGLTFQQSLDYGEALFIRNNISAFLLDNIISPSGTIAITDYDASCGTEVVIPSTLKFGYVLNDLTDPNNASALNACISFFSSGDYDVREDLDSGSTVTSFCQGTGTAFGGTTLEDNISYFLSNDLQFLLANNILVEETARRNVEIIKSRAFRGKNLTSVVIPNGIEKIFAESFTNNSITTVTIPTSVTYLSCTAFDGGVTITLNNPNLACRQEVK